MGTKEIYQKKITSQVDSLSCKIQSLRADCENNSTINKAEADKFFQDLDIKLKQLNHLLDELSSDSEKSWNEVKMEVERSFLDLQSAYQLVLNKFG